MKKYNKPVTKWVTLDMSGVLCASSDPIAPGVTETSADGGKSVLSKENNFGWEDTNHNSVWDDNDAWE